MVETHCHTLVSAHAHSTMGENIKTAKERGMEGLCLTNHGPGIPDCAHEWHFSTLTKVPEFIDGIRFFSGIEANIMDYNGGLGCPDSLLARLDWVIASIHSPCLEPSNISDITSAYIGALENPFVDCLGHIGQNAYLCDFESVVKKAKKLDKIIEINNHSLNGVRPGAEVLCKEIALLSKKYGSKIVVSSDAHYCGSVGVYDKALAMLSEIDFPEELIMNTSLSKFENHIRRK